MAGEGGGGGGGMSAGTGGRKGEEERDGGGSWYRGWRWRWQSQCPSTRTGSRQVAANDPRQLLFTLHRASRRAKRAGWGRGRRETAGPREGKKREGKRIVGTWKADGPRSRRKGENEMKSARSSVPRRARARTRDVR